MLPSSLYFEYLEQRSLLTGTGLIEEPTSKPTAQSPVFLADDGTYLNLLHFLDGNLSIVKEQFPSLASTSFLTDGPYGLFFQGLDATLNLAQWFQSMQTTENSFSTEAVNHFFVNTLLTSASLASVFSNLILKPAGKDYQDADQKTELFKALALNIAFADLFVTTVASANQYDYSLDSIIKYTADVAQVAFKLVSVNLLLTQTLGTLSFFKAKNLFQGDFSPQSRQFLILGTGLFLIHHHLLGDERPAIHD